MTNLIADTLTTADNPMIAAGLVLLGFLVGEAATWLRDWRYGRTRARSVRKLVLHEVSTNRFLVRDFKASIGETDTTMQLVNAPTLVWQSAAWSSQLPDLPSAFTGPELDDLHAFYVSLRRIVAIQERLKQMFGERTAALASAAFVVTSQGTALTKEFLDMCAMNKKIAFRLLGEFRSEE